MNLRKMKIKEILLEVRHIRKKGLPFYSNYFNQCKDMEDDFLVFSMKYALAFEWNDLGVKRVYFFASVLEDLEYILSCVDKESVIDFVTKDKEALREVFENSGYRRYVEYGRFYIKPNNEKVEKLRMLSNDKDLMNVLINSSYGELALEDDAEKIDKCLRNVFDSYEAHFYSLDKLREHIRKGWVWIVKEKGKIIAGSLFEIQGKKVYSAYTWNEGNIDVLFSLDYKMNQYLSSLNVTHYYCWMRLDNKRAIRYATKYGGNVSDGLYDVIYVKK